jgi:SAM-dependent methyltransferase
MCSDVKRVWDACGRAFDRYTNAPDSFSGNIERPEIERLAGDVTNKRVLDLGCGSGAYALWFAGRGARVTGLDLSPEMIELARSKAAALNLQLDLRVADIGKPFELEGADFDLVFTGTALHYVERLGSVTREAARVMKPGAAFIASVLHPISTARFPLAGSGADDPDLWQTRYFDDALRSIETPWLGYGDVSGEGRTIHSYHHTVSDYFSALTSAGLTVTDLCEPRPPADFLLRNAARYDEAFRVPIYLVFRAVR